MKRRDKRRIPALESTLNNNDFQKRGEEKERLKDVEEIFRSNRDEIGVVKAIDRGAGNKRGDEEINIVANCVSQWAKRSGDRYQANDSDTGTIM